MAAPLVLALLALSGSVWAKALLSAPQFRREVPRLTEIYVNDAIYSGVTEDPAGTGGFMPWLRSGAYGLCFAEVTPGTEYTLGLILPADVKRVSVYLFDRWPGSPEAAARRIELQAVPAAGKANPAAEFRWRIGISKKSSGRALYIALSADTGEEAASIPYKIFLSTPAIAPAAALENGVAYMKGPLDLALKGEDTLEFLHIIERRRPFDRTNIPAPLIKGDLVKNGWFREGLNHWHPHIDYIELDRGSGGFFSVQGGDLKVWSKSFGTRAGLMEHIDADVSGATGLILRADVMVAKEAREKPGSGPDAPVALAVCYEDERGKDHCGNNAFRKGFYISEDEERGPAPGGEVLRRGLWYRYVIDLMTLAPRPRKIKYISLEGSGRPLREGWIRDVHLIKNIEFNERVHRGYAAAEIPLNQR